MREQSMFSADASPFSADAGQSLFELAPVEEMEDTSERAVASSQHPSLYRISSGVVSDESSSTAEEVLQWIDDQVTLEAKAIDDGTFHGTSFRPYNFAASPEHLVVMVDGVNQDLLLSVDLPDIQTAVDVVNELLQGAVAWVSRKNLVLSSLSVGMQARIQIGPDSGLNAVELFGAGWAGQHSYRSVAKHRDQIKAATTPSSGRSMLLPVPSQNPNTFFATYIGEDVHRKNILLKSDTESIAADLSGKGLKRETTSADVIKWAREGKAMVAKKQSHHSFREVAPGFLSLDNGCCTSSKNGDPNVFFVSYLPEEVFPENVRRLSWVHEVAAILEQFDQEYVRYNGRDGQEFRKIRHLFEEVTKGEL
jgi:hypothetical protein